MPCGGSPCSPAAAPTPLQAAQRRLARRQRQLSCQPSASLSLEAVKDVGGLVLFSALPFVAVQALADSKLGKDLLAGLEAQKPLLRRQAAQQEAERRAARQQRCGSGALVCRLAPAVEQGLPARLTAAAH